MDAALTLLFNALVAGAAAGLKPTAEKAIADAYTGLKNLVAKKWTGRATLAQLEAAPAAPAAQEALKQDLEAQPVLADATTLRQAQELLKAVAAHDADAAREVGITITDLKAQTEIDIEGLMAQGGSIRVAALEAGGSIRIKDVRAENPPRR